MTELIFTKTPRITIASNTFVDVPIILRYEDLDLISLVQEEKLGLTTSIPIYHSDGTKLAKVVGTRVYETEEGRKANVKTLKYPGHWVCQMDGKTMFEIKQEPGENFKTTAELFTNDGYFVRCNNNSSGEDNFLGKVDLNGDKLEIGGISMWGNTMMGCRVGLWFRKDGSFRMGVN